MGVLGLMVAFCKLVPFHPISVKYSTLQRNLLSAWKSEACSLPDLAMLLSSQTRTSLSWWFPTVTVGKYFLHYILESSYNRCKSVRLGSLIILDSWATWSGEDKLPINLLELRYLRLSLQYWTPLLKGHSTRVQ